MFLAKDCHSYNDIQKLNSNNKLKKNDPSIIEINTIGISTTELNIRFCNSLNTKFLQNFFLFF